MVERAVVADLGGLADDDTHAVIDEETPADSGAGVDLDAGQETANVRQKARKPSQPPAPEPVRHAMEQQRMETRIAGDDLEARARGGVAVEDHADVFPKCREHAFRSSHG